MQRRFLPATLGVFMLALGLSSRSSGVVLEDLVAVPIDVGKHAAMAKVIDFTGKVLVKPFEFKLDRSGVGELVSRVETACPSAVLVRVGLEAAGHYHLPLSGGVLPPAWDLRLLNPGHVATQRKANGQRGVKTDRVDLAAIADLLLAGRGTPAPPFADPVMEPAGRVAHRQRRSLQQSPAPHDPTADHPCRPVLPGPGVNDVVRDVDQGGPVDHLRVGRSGTGRPPRADTVARVRCPPRRANDDTTR